MLLTLKPCPSRICVSFSSSFQRFSLNVFLVLRPQLLVKAPRFFFFFSAHFLFFQRGVRRLIYSTHREPRSGPRRNLEKLESCRCVVLCCAVLCASPLCSFFGRRHAMFKHFIFFFERKIQFKVGPLENRPV